MVIDDTRQEKSRADEGRDEERGEEEASEERWTVRRTRKAVQGTR